MKQEAPALLPILRSRVQAEILTALFTDPAVEMSISDLARFAGAQVSNAHNEVNRLQAAELVTDRRVGRTRLVRANQANELFRPLSEIIVKTYGPRQLLSRTLIGIDDVDEAYIFGSWARRYLGQPGAAPRDIDVLIVGNPDRRRLNRLLSEEAEKIGKEINAVTISPAEWRDKASGFLKTVGDSPLIDLLDSDMK